MWVGVLKGVGSSARVGALKFRGTCVAEDAACSNERESGTYPKCDKPCRFNDIVAFPLA